MKEVEVGGRRFQLYPPKGRAAIELDRQACRLYARLDTSLGMGPAYMEAFGSMPEDEFSRLVSLSLPGAVMLGEDRDARLSDGNVWDLFLGRVDELYGLMLAAWEAYDLTPFAKLRSGSSTAPTP